MAPSAVDYRGIMTNGVNGHDAGKIDTMNPHELVNFDPSLKPKDYQIKGTDPSSKVLFLDVNIIDSTGADPFNGDVYIEGMLADAANWRLYGAEHIQASASSTLARCRIETSFPKIRKYARYKAKAGLS